MDRKNLFEMMLKYVIITLYLLKYHQNYSEFNKIKMSRKVELKANVRVLSNNFQDSRYSYNKSIDSTIHGKDTEYTQSQYNFPPNNNSFFQCEELKEADQKEECSIIQNTSKKVSKQDLHHKLSKRNYLQSNQHYYLTNQQAKVIQLSQRLRNLHVFYNYMIKAQKQKNMEKNQTVMSVIDILEKSHIKKLEGFQQKLLQLRNKNYIKSKKVVQQQVRSIKKQNNQLIQQINRKKRSISEKESLTQILQREKYELVDKLHKKSHERQSSQQRNQQLNNLLKEFGI